MKAFTIIVQQHELQQSHIVLFALKLTVSISAHNAPQFAFKIQNTVPTLTEVYGAAQSVLCDIKVRTVL